MVSCTLSFDRNIFHVGVDIGGLEFHDDGAQAVVTAHDRDTRFADPVAVVEQVAARTMGEREHILVNRLPSLVAEALRLCIGRHEHVALLHHRASFDADGAILPRQLLVERRLKNCDLNFLHRLYIFRYYVSFRVYRNNLCQVIALPIKTNDFFK